MLILQLLPTRLRALGLTMLSVIAVLVSGALLSFAAPLQQPEIDQLIADITPGISELAELQLTDFEFTDAEEPSNLYLTVYQLLNAESDEGALIQVAAMSDFDLFQVRSVIQEGSVAELPGTAEEKQTAALAIREAYDQALPLQKARGRILAQVHWQQVYSDGDTSNSEFDLITDLQEIHDQLFTGKPATFLQDDPDRPINPNYQQLLSTTNQLQRPSSQLETVSATEPEVEEAFCPIDPELTAALRSHNRSVSNDDNTPNNSDNTDLNTQSQNLNNAGSTDFVASQIADLLPSNNFPCAEGKFFCVTVEQEFAYAQNYFPADNNCVACRIGVINEHLSELLAKDLHPDKITGKFGELAECKDSISRLPLDLVITFQSQPIRDYQDPTKAQITENGATDTEPKAKTNQSDTITQSNRTQPTTLTELLERRRSIEQQIDQKNVAEQRSEEQASSVSSIVSNPEVVRTMQEFNAYLRAFQTELQQIQVTVEAISAKPNCS